MIFKSPIKTLAYWTLILGVLPVLVFSSVYFLDQKGFFNIDQIELSVVAQENQKNFSKPYLDRLNQQFDLYKGQSLWKFSLSTLSVKLKQESWIKEFRLSRAWPSKIEIEIVPHTLSFLFADSAQLAKGFVRPVTNSGDLLAEVETQQAPALALLKGSVFATSKQKRLKAIELLESLPSEGKMKQQLVSEVGYDIKEGFWLEVIRSSTKIQFGEEQFMIKAARASQVLDYLEKRDLKARVIDANLSKKVLVRLQQNP